MKYETDLLIAKSKVILGSPCIRTLTYRAKPLFSTDIFSLPIFSKFLFFLYDKVGPHIAALRARDLGKHCSFSLVANPYGEKYIKLPSDDTKHILGERNIKHAYHYHTTLLLVSMINYHHPFPFTSQASGSFLSHISVIVNNGTLTSPGLFSTGLHFKTKPTPCAGNPWHAGHALGDQLSLL